MQELILTWAFGFFCGLMLFSVVDAIKFWSKVFDAYYWVKDKWTDRKWLRR